MTIKNMTDKGLSFPQIGIIRKGAKKEPNGPGKDLPYFRVDFAEHEKKSAADFAAAYANKDTGLLQPPYHIYFLKFSILFLIMPHFSYFVKLFMLMFC